MKAKHIFARPTLSAADVRALCGDTGIAGQFFGFAKHRELEFLVARRPGRRSTRFAPRRRPRRRSSGSTIRGHSRPARGAPAGVSQC
jgi:hypothetical protein